jgi:hypothetical protein
MNVTYIENLKSAKLNFLCKGYYLGKFFYLEKYLIWKKFSRCCAEFLLKVAESCLLKPKYYGL